ncbi:MAG TPA: cobyrinate a,c-diamide synthase [Blastocatellia bacterium]|nr:cobyrinate a,c-diamide synthase [Blastocatellia bacterium]
MTLCASKQTRTLVVAGTHSGAGKSTIAAALMAAYIRRGLRVRAFKVGPDFIDPGFHVAATGHPSRNLDGWMMGREVVLETFLRASANADLALVEGVMGLFDGASADNDTGSTAEIAKWLGAPVLLVIDASALARTAAAIVRGFEEFDPDLNVAAVIANKVAGEAHYRYLEPAIIAHCRTVPVGWMPADASIHFPERHLGLVTYGAGTSSDRVWLEKLADLAEQSIDLDGLLSLSQVPDIPESLTTGIGARSDLKPPSPSNKARIKIGVALDRAFCFYYQDNLDLLESLGAELVYWSPIQDPLPDSLAGLYFGGGYPELYAEQLSANVRAREAVKSFIDRGGPVYAECGGLMYLTDAIVETSAGSCEGVEHKMVGAFPTICRMRSKLVAIGYSEVTVSAQRSGFLDRDCAARGQQFRYSEIDPMPRSVTRCYRIRPASGIAEKDEGYVVRNCLASYVHLHFSSCPEFVERWIDRCRSHLQYQEA